MIKRGAGALGLTLLLAAATASAAPAAPTWLPPVSFGASSATIPAPSLAMSPRGDVVSVWNAATDGSTGTVFARYRPAGADLVTGNDWGDTSSLSGPVATPVQPAVAIDGPGNAVAVWDNWTGDQWAAVASTRPAGGAWRAPEAISAPSSSPRLTAVAMNRRGDALALWTQPSPGGPNRLQSAFRPVGGAWQPAREVVQTGSDDIGDPHVALDEAGNAVVTWMTEALPIPFLVHAATAQAGGPWSSPVTLSAATSTPAIGDLAIDPGGDAVAAWQEDGVVRTATRPAGGMWSPAATLATTAGYVHLALADSGAAYALLAKGVGGSGPETVQFVTRPPGADWQAPVILDTATMRQGDLAVDGRGDAIAVWIREASPGLGYVEAATKPASGAWSATIGLAYGDASSLPSTGIDGDGDGAALWVLTNRSVQARGFDTTGPKIEISGPATATAVESRVTFTDTAADTWSRTGSTIWNFGDGTGAARVDATATHVYTKPGAYTVSATVSDFSGNATTASRQIVVAPQPRPVLSNVHQSHKKWRAEVPPIVFKPGKAPLGDTVSFDVNTVVTNLVVGFQHVKPGRKAHGRCARPSRSNRKRPKCTRTVSRRTITYNLQSGQRSVHFDARLANDKPWTAGDYVATLSARSASGELSAPRRIRFTIVK